MPRPGPAKMPIAIRLSMPQIEAIHAEGRHLVATGAVDPDEYLHEDGSVNITQVMRYHLGKSIVGWPK